MTAVTDWPTFAIVLEARAPEAGRWRRYDLRAGRDMLVDWIVETRFGRIGAEGRCLRWFVEGEAEARRLVRQVLQRRRTAPRRIGATSIAIETQHPFGWIDAAASSAASCSSAGREDPSCDVG